MQHFSYISLKIIHDQKIQEALARQRLNAEQATQKQRLLRTFKKFRARFHNHPAKNKQEFLPDCAEASTRPF